MSSPLSRVAAVAAWAAYGPLGLQYACFLALAALALQSLVQKNRWRDALHHRPFIACAALLGWLALSALWSRAPALAVATHLWTYSLMLWVPILALALPRDAASRALTHFVAASSVVALAFMLESLGWLPAAGPWRPFVDVSGNQRIVYSVLLALGAALALLRSLDLSAWTARTGWAAATVVCLLGLAAQDRRTGMLLAPLLLGLVLVARQPGAPRRAAAVVLIAAAAALAWWLAPNVQQRFAEGWRELRAYQSLASVESSWGMRARMLELTADMVLEAPLSGHGVGSWVTEWRPRVAGQAALEAHTTPHNEALLLAVQGGLVALALAALALGFAVRSLWRRGSDALAPAMVLLALLTAAQFNVALRDAKFALPLLLLTALAWASIRDQPSDR